VSFVWAQNSFRINLRNAVNIFLVCYDLPGTPTTLAALVTQCALFRLLQLVLYGDYAINLITHKHTGYTVATTQSLVYSALSTQVDCYNLETR